MASLGLAPGQPRALAFAPDGVRTDLRLLEVDEALLAEIIAKGVAVKGGEDDEAVLVTSNKTYAMKHVETTNLQLLVRPKEGMEGAEEKTTGGGQRFANTGFGQGLMTQWEGFRAASGAPVLVEATNTSHIELVEVAPRMGPLRAMLWERPYGLEQEGEEMEVDGTAAGGGGGRAGGYTFEELLAAVQASPGELLSALEAEGAMRLYGRWRAVEGSYLGGLLELLLLTCEQEGMPTCAVREEVVAGSLASDGYHPDVVRHCLKVYGKRVDGGGGSGASSGTASTTAGAGGSSGGGEDGAAGSGAVWALDEAKVCVHFAQKLLSTGGAAAAAGRGAGTGAGGTATTGGSSSRGMGLTEFLAAWSRAVPHGMKPSLDMVRAEALVEGSGPEARIFPFPASSLPADPAARFAALFLRRPRWEWSALEPYLAGIKVPGQSVEALLMRFARASQPTPSAPLVYSAR
ncbi:hypothetical protein Agub_g7298 [Astrephomene gubernaculifera]|uniref:Sister chromatid cohesion protein DCC1 n=1 Tax=Astrephomene gubernaculifera TaxID=47775 RepID=A0AAD3HMR8_9CHLO|nr:hypothetical protein Agub_g7298 [Astrephomene gubernaculifera]